MAKVQLFYFHDPMCSWCWGYRPVFERLKNKLPDDVALRYAVGGLAPDNDESMPLELRQMLQSTWRKIEQQLGVKFNHDFWRNCQPRRSTYLACRAVLAAGMQGQYEAMILAIQQAYYLRALNPSDLPVLVNLAAELALDVEQFEANIGSDAIEQSLQQEITMARAWPISGFPSLVLKVNGNVMPVALDYQDESRTLADIQRLISEQ